MTQPHSSASWGTSTRQRIRVGCRPVRNPILRCFPVGWKRNGRSEIDGQLNNGEVIRLTNVGAEVAAAGRHVPPPEVPGHEAPADDGLGQPWPQAPTGAATRRARGRWRRPGSRARRSRARRRRPSRFLPAAAGRLAPPHPGNRCTCRRRRGGGRTPSPASLHRRGAGDAALLLASALGGGADSSGASHAGSAALLLAVSALVLYGWQGLAAWFSLAAHRRPFARALGVPAPQPGVLLDGPSRARRRLRGERRPRHRRAPAARRSSATSRRAPAPRSSSSSRWSWRLSSRRSSSAGSCSAGSPTGGAGCGARWPRRHLRPRRASNWMSSSRWPPSGTSSPGPTSGPGRSGPASPCTRSSTPSRCWPGRSRGDPARRPPASHARTAARAR